MDIFYIAPCGRRLRTFPEIQNYLDLKAVADLSIEHFTFSRKVDVGEVLDGDKVREGRRERREGVRDGRGREGRRRGKSERREGGEEVVNWE